MGKGGAAQMEVTDYRMSVHWGICHGPVDMLLGIYVGQKQAWAGEVSSNAIIPVNATELFGGVKKEGGVSGSVQYLAGNADQTMPEKLAQKLGRTSDTCPAYRDITSAFFYGDASFDFHGAIDLVGAIIGNYSFGAFSGGFLWGSNNPYLKDIWFKVRRAPRGLAEEFQAIGRSLTVSVNGNTVSVNGVSDTVTQGVAQTINGSLVTLELKTLTIDGTDITVDMEQGSIHDPDSGVITVGGISATRTEGQPLTVNNVTVTVNGSYRVDIDIPHADTITIANFTAVFGTLADANPAAIIYECLTNTDWGMGGALSSINLTSFEDAARTLRAEGLGLSMMWAKQTTIEAFVQEVLDHIQATMFINPRDGLMTLKLIRGDYVIDDLPLLTPDNCKVTSFARKGWGETTNEIVVTWTNPENEQEETVSAQNLANIQIQGTPVSDSRNYYGVRRADLAMQLAKRDLASVSAPLASFEIDADRSAWDFVPGGCARLTYPEEGIEDLVIRIGKIDYGKAGSPTIKLSAMEDIFSEPIGAYHKPDESQWNAGLSDPQPMEHVRILTAPAYFTIREHESLVYPEVITAVLASTADSDAKMYELVGQNTLPNGDVVGQLLGSREVLGYAELPVALVTEAQSVLTDFGTLSGGVGPTPGGFVFIGDATEEYQEVALVQSYDTTTSKWVINRGVLDTVPRNWSIGTPVWFLSFTSNFLDSNSVRSQAEAARYKLLPQASNGTLSQADAPIQGTVLTARPHLPTRPANVVVAGHAFGGVDLSGSSPSSVTVTWSNRNRLVEDGQVLKWTDSTVVAEDGQTTTITVRGVDGTVITTHSGLTGTSFDVPVASFGSAGTADIVVTSARDGLNSLQGHAVRVTIAGTAPGGDPGGVPGGGGGGGGGSTDPTPGGGFGDVPRYIVPLD